MTELGVVTSVNVNQDAKKIFVSVAVSPEREHEYIRFLPPAKAMWVVPEINDVVEVEEVSPGRLVARASHQEPTFSMPKDLSNGDVAVKLNDQSFLHFKKNPDGTVDLDIKCDGEMRFEAADVFVTEGGTAKKVALEGHKHDFTYDGGGKNSSTLSGTTDPPDAGGLSEVEIE